jgi:hypothetical protein
LSTQSAVRIRSGSTARISGAVMRRASVNSYIDTTVVNGVKYYYALVSYDMGVVPTKIDPFFGPTGGLTPS